MITDLRTETPENGFRYTHDVLWHQKLVGQATEVRLLPRSREFTWFAFVEFNATTEARSAVATDDILETDHRWDPAADHSNSQECSIAAQYVLLRGQDRNGSFDLIKKESPDPIPGMQVPTPEDLRCLRESWPNVIAW